jgi:hypothetical protein
MLKKYLLLLTGILLVPIIFDNALGEIDSARFELVYPNGDRISIENSKLVVTSDDKEIEFEKIGKNSEHYFELELPLQKKYEILVFTNDMLVGTKYLEFENKILDVIKIHVNPSIGIKFFVYYNDGVTPIKNVDLKIYSHKDNLIRTTTTDDEGKTQRFWLASTITDGDFYKVEVSVDDLVYHYPTIRRFSASHDFNIITSWPSTIDSITIQTFTNNILNHSWGKNFIAEIYKDGTLEKSAKFIRGKTYFSQLTIGEHRVIIFDEKTPLNILADTKILIKDSSDEYKIQIDDSYILDPNLTKLSKSNSSKITKTQNGDIVNFSSLGWTKQSHSGIQEKPLESQYFLNMITDGDGNPVFTRSEYFEPMDLSDKNLQISYKIDKPLSVKEFWIYFSSDKFESSWFTIKVPISEISSNEQISKIFDLSKARITGMVDLTKINQVQIRIKDNSEDKIQVQISDFKIHRAFKSNPVVEKTMESSIVPSWLKNNAKWWSEQKVSDVTFVSGIKFLINKEFIQIEQSKKPGMSSTKIPYWIKNSAKWWSENEISDTEFITSIQYLLNHQIIQIKF